MQTHIFLTFLTLTSFIFFGQNNARTFQLTCDEKMPFDSMLISDKYIRHKIISKQRLHDNTTYLSEIILPDFDQSYDKTVLLTLFQRLSDLNEIDEFSAFTNCGARFIYISSYTPGSKERKAFEKYFIGNFRKPFEKD